MEEVPRMNQEQFRKAKNLIKRMCANYDNGHCLLLDDGEECVCVQSISYSLLCRYFRTAVLPNDRDLHDEILGISVRRRICGECGNLFHATSQQRKYCASCSALRIKRQKAEWRRRKQRKP